MKWLIWLIAGVLFGAGLAISGMTNPTKVQAFLDITGDWDPVLAFVMASAIAVAFFGQLLMKQRDKALLGDEFAQPASQTIDARLIIGALLFGIGWGLYGFCPGPAIAAISYGQREVGLFLFSMAFGMALHRLLLEHKSAG